MSSKSFIHRFVALRFFILIHQSDVYCSFLEISIGLVLNLYALNRLENVIESL